MIERATDKVAETAFFEIIVILLVILVVLIIISNFLLKKKEYKKNDEGEYISVENFLFIIGWGTLIIFLLIGYFNYFNSGLSIIQLLKFTLIETGIILILTIFLLFNYGYIGQSHFSGYIYATIFGIFSIASFIATILLAILTNSLPILAAIGLSGITSLSYLINSSESNPNDELPELIEQVEPIDEIGNIQTNELIEQVEPVGEIGDIQKQNLIEQDVSFEEIGDNNIFEDTKLIPEDIYLNETLPELVNVKYNNQLGKSNITYRLPEPLLPRGTQIVDPDNIQTYQQNNTTGLLDIITNPVVAINSIISTLIYNPQSIIPGHTTILGGSGFKEKRKIIIVMACLILLILDKKK